MFFNSIPILPHWADKFAFPLNRWLHIVCTTALVGGTLFYEFVIPRALEDLPETSQAAVMGRVRWVFRRIVIVSTILLVISGLVSSWRIWPMYSMSADAATFWWGVHTVGGIVAMAIAARITLGNRVPRSAIKWLRINFVLLLAVLFAASIARYIRLNALDQAAQTTPK